MWVKNFIFLTILNIFYLPLPITCKPKVFLKFKKLLKKKKKKKALAKSRVIMNQEVHVGLQSAAKVQGQALGS